MSIFSALRPRQSSNVVRTAAETAARQAARPAPRETPAPSGDSDRVTLSEEARTAQASGNAFEFAGRALREAMQGKEPAFRVPDERTDGLVPNDENRNSDPERVRRQEAAIRQALQGGQCMEWTNANGQREVVSVRPTENGQYELRGQDGHPINIEFDADIEPEERVTALARITDFHTQTPTHLRDALDNIEVTSGHNGTRMAEQGHKTMRFFGGITNVTNQVFDHEFGHAIGRKLNRDAQTRMMAENPLLMMMPRNSFSATPSGWEEAMEKDILAPSRYSRTGTPEDFSESYSIYRDALEEGPEAVEALRRQFPERVAYLERVMVPPPPPRRPFYLSA